MSPRPGGKSGGGKAKTTPKASASGKKQPNRTKRNSPAVAAPRGSRGARRSGRQ